MSGIRLFGGVVSAPVSALIMMLGSTSPALASEALNQAEVSACLAENVNDPTACMSEVFHPCAEMRGAGRLRNCFHKLGKSWQGLAERAAEDTLNQALPRMQLFVLLHRDDGHGAASAECEAAATDFLQPLGAANSQVVTQACAVFGAATTWQRLAAGPEGLSASYSTFQADVESMESCVLETGHIGEEQSCTGLIASGCEDDGKSLATCVAHERRVWVAIAQDALGALEPVVALKNLPSRHRGQHVTGCGANDGSVHYVRCQMRSTARVASELLLDQEN